MLTKCDQCREMHQERRDRGIDSWPPCEDCRGEDLLPANQEAAFIYDLARGQVITRNNGRWDEVMDLNYQAVKTIMDLYEIKNQRQCFEKVRRAFFYFLRKERENRE